jgi:YggT family protein
MFMIGYFLLALAKLLNMAFYAYIWIVIGRAIISWVNADPYNPIVRFLIQATDPVLQKIRRYVPPMGGVDLSSMLLIFTLIFLQSFIVPTLDRIGNSLL